MARPKEFQQPKKISFQIEQSQFDSLIKDSSVSDVLQGMVKFYIHWKWLARVEGWLRYVFVPLAALLRTVFSSRKK